MEFMEVQGRQYPVIDQVERKNGDIVPLLDIRMMSDEEWQRSAEEQAIKNFRKWYGREPVSADEAFEGQRLYINMVPMHFPLTEDMFFSPELSKPINKAFIKAFIDVVNHCYEGGKKPGNGYSCMTPELLKAEYARIYNEDPDDSNMAIFFPVLADYMTDAWRQGIMDSGKIVDVPLSEIQIYPCFTEHPPGPGKMETKAQYFSETGFFQSDIVLDMRNHLIDGYTSYLLAKQSGMECVPVRYVKRQIVRACHRPGGKLYEWELPEKLVDRVSSGDKVLVHTRGGARFVTVTSVKPYRPKEHTMVLRMVIKVKKSSRKGGVPV